jgi:hypothetical protein
LFLYFALSRGNFLQVLSHCERNRLLKKLKIELPYDPAIPLLGIYTEECKSGYNKACTPMFIAALFKIAELWKQSRCPITNECIKKM